MFCLYSTNYIKNSEKFLTKTSIPNTLDPVGFKPTSFSWAIGLPLSYLSYDIKLMVWGVGGYYPIKSMDGILVMEKKTFTCLKIINKNLVFFYFQSVHHGQLQMLDMYPMTCKLDRLVKWLHQNYTLQLPFLELFNIQLE